jgi:hypothetical protein
VSVFLCNFLDDHGVKSVKVLKKAGLRPETQKVDWHSGDAVHALYMASQCSCPKHFILIVRLPLTTMLLTSSPLSLILTLTLVRPESFSFSLVGRVQGLFSCFSLSLRFPFTSYVEGSSLTTSLRYQDLRFL